MPVKTKKKTPAPVELLTAARYLRRLWTASAEATGLDQKQASAKLSGAMQMFGAVYYDNHQSDAYVIEEIRNAFAEHGPKPAGYGRAAEVQEWTEAIDTDLAARLSHSIREYVSP